MIRALAAAIAIAVAAGTAPQAPDRRQVTIVAFETEKGTIEVAVDGARAPVTAGNFLRYVDGGFFDGGTVNRAVRPDNTVRHDIEIQVIQSRSPRRRARSSRPFRWSAPALPA